MMVSALYHKCLKSDSQINVYLLIIQIVSIPIIFSLPAYFWLQITAGDLTEMNKQPQADSLEIRNYKLSV